MAARGVPSYDKRFDKYMGTLSTFVGAIGVFAGFGKSKYFTTDTGLPTHQNMMDNPLYFRDKKGIAWKIIWMTSEEYERAVYRGFDVEARLRGKQKAIPEGMSVREFRIDRKHLEKIKNIMREKKIDMPYLRYHTYRSFHDRDQINQAFDQEGHHRVVAAEELGETHIPVFIEFPSDKKYFDIARPLMTQRIKAEIEGDVVMSAGGIIRKPYRTPQQAELEYLEKWERARQIEREVERSPTLYDVPKDYHEKLEKKRREEEFDRMITETRRRPTKVIKTERLLKLEDFP